MTEPLRPDAISTQNPSGWDAVAPIVREAALTLPNVAKLIFRILRDERVPRSTKVFAAGMGVYLVSPIDLLPEAILGPLGKVDDLLLAAYTVDRLVKVAGPQVVAEHWDGSTEAGEFVETLLDITSHLVPRPIRQLLERLGG